MISEPNSFSTLLNQMLTELCTKRPVSLNEEVLQRLDKAFSNYCEDLNASYNLLTRQKTLKSKRKIIKNL